jgi:hypothetical protein
MNLNIIFKFGVKNAFSDRLAYNTKMLKANLPCLLRELIIHPLLLRLQNNRPTSFFLLLKKAFDELAFINQPTRYDSWLL